MRMLMVVLALTIGGLAVFRAILESRRESPALSSAPIITARIPAVLGPAPAFELIERSGRVVRSEELKGQVWIANFIFTRCLGPCPGMTANMARLQNMLTGAPGIRLVTFTVDPEHDRPEVLRDYANRAGADATRWLFLTGTIEQIDAVQSKGFKMGVPGESIHHSDRFVLVDADGRIREYVDMNEPGAVERLAAKAVELARNGGR